MDENLQHIDDLFNRAYESFEEDPSTAAWESLNAALDKEDVDKNKRRFIGWKRTAVLLLFFCSGLLIYEAWVQTKSNNENAMAKKNLSAHPKSVSIIKQTKPNTTENNSTRIGNNILEEQKNKKERSISVSEAAEDQQDENTLSTKNDKNKNARLTKIFSTYIFYNRKNERQTESSFKSFITNKKINFKAYNNTTFKLTTAITKTDKTDDAVINSEGKTASLFPNARIDSLVPLQINLPQAKSPVHKPFELPETLHAQSNNKIQAKKATSSFKPYWSLTVFASNDWGKYQLADDVQDNNQQDDREDINRREKHEPSVSAGILAAKQFTSKWGLRTGIIYSITSIAIDSQEIYAAKKPDGNIAYKYITSSGYGFVKPVFGLPPAIGDSIQSASTQHNLQVLSFPLMLSYRIDKKKFGIAHSAGISANIITSASVKTKVTDALNKEAVSLNKLNGMQSVYAGFIADMNLQYNYNNRWSFNLLPGFKHAITPITKINVVKTFPYSYSVGAGATYKL